MMEVGESLSETNSALLTIHFLQPVGMFCLLHPEKTIRDPYLFEAAPAATSNARMLEKTAERLS